MVRSEAQKRADKKYDPKYKKERTKQIGVRFFPSDMELFNHAKSQDNVNGYIKDLIRADMERKAEE